MRLPYEKYLLYLVLTKHSDQEIINFLQKAGLPKVGNNYMKALRVLLAEDDVELAKFLKSDDGPILVKFRRTDIEDSWLEKFDLEDAHTGSNGFNETFEVFNDKRKRNTLNIYCLCPDLLPERISEIYQEKFGDEIPIDCMDTYKKYFFDINILNETEWQHYIGRFDPKTRMLYESAPTRRSKYVRWKMGEEIYLDPSDVSNLLMTDFFFLAQDAHLSQSDDWHERATKFASVALNASDRALKNKKVTGKNMKMDLVTLFEEEEKIPEFEELDESEHPEVDIDGIKLSS